MQLDSSDYLNIFLTIITILPFFLFKKRSARKETGKLLLNVYGAFLFSPQHDSQTGKTSQMVRFVLTNEGGRPVMINSVDILVQDTVVKEIEIFEKLDKSQNTYRGEVIISDVPETGYQKATLRFNCYGVKKPLLKDVVLVKHS